MCNEMKVREREGRECTKRRKRRWEYACVRACMFTRVEGRGRSEEVMCEAERINVILMEGESERLMFMRKSRCRRR